MGKAILIVLVAALLGCAIALRNTQEVAFAADGVISQQEEELLAREIARSASNKAVGEAMRAFDTAETIAYDDISYQSGSYDVSSERLDASTVVIESEGTFKNRVFRIRTTLTRVSAIDAPIMANGGSASVTFGGNNARVVGIDTPPPSAPSSSGSPTTDTNGVKTSSEAVATEFLDALGSKPERVYGVDGNGDVIYGSFALDPQDLYEDAKAIADQTIPGGSISGNVTYGSPSSPAVVVVEGSASFSGQVTGYGVLVIDGDLTGSGQFTWEGLVIAKSDGLNVQLSGNARIYGAALLLGESAGGGCSGGSDLCVSISGNGGAYFSSHTISRLASRLPSVSSVVIADRWVGLQ